MRIRITLLAAAAAIAFPAMAGAQVTPPPTDATPPPAAATPPAATPPAATAPATTTPATTPPATTPPPADEPADEAAQQAQDSAATASPMAHETAERAADAVEAEAVSESQIHAQSQTMPPPAAPAPGEAAAQAQTPVAAGPVAPATRVDFSAGAQVHDQAGGVVGTIETADASGAVVATGTVRAKLPIASFGRNAQGLVIAMTRAQLEAAVASQTPTPSS